MRTLIKVVLILLLLLCLFDMPYGFYQFVRFISMIGFGILAYSEYKEDNTTYLIIYGALAVLFQPIIKISLGRELWNIVDFIVAVALIISLFRSKK